MILWWLLYIKIIQLLGYNLKGRNLIIDLIAVSSNYRGQKIGTALIKFASENIKSEKILVVPKSVTFHRLNYQKLGFNHIESDYVFLSQFIIC